jgi:tetratricopeptide (TPR) repeat protein
MRSGAIEFERPEPLRRAPRAIAPRLALAALAALAVGLGQPATAAAEPDAAERSLEQARAGAEHFKAKRFIEAARAFEGAYRTNPVDPRNLRYAGRAWEEVGVIDRAISLFERYLQVETNPEHRQSIVPRLDALKAKTPRERAEALAMATIKYPQGRLEEEAAQAFERLGDKASLERAIKLYETSRLWAETPEAKAAVDANINRVRAQMAALDKAAREPKGPDPKPPGSGGPGVTKPQPPASDGLGTALYVIGGVAVLAGGGLGGWGYLSHRGALDDNLAGKFKSKDDYEAATESARTLNTVGWVVAGTGVAVLGVAILRTVLRDDAPPATSTLRLTPTLGAGQAGLALGGRF